VIPVHFVANWSSVTIGAWPKTKALLHNSAGKRIKLRHSRRSRDPASADATIRLDSQGDADPPADACPTFRGLYHGLEELEREMHLHVHLENHILFPRAAALVRDRTGQ